MTDETWISELGIHYKLGVDGLNLLLVAADDAAVRGAALWAATAPVGARRGCSTSASGSPRPRCSARFCAQDLALFVLFFDLMLIPFYFLVGQWGAARTACGRRSKLVIYTLVGSLLMLAARGRDGGARRQHGDGHADVRALRPRAATRCREGSQEWIFLCFAAAFLVKMPAFPLHGWMPDGYRAMPLPVLAVFSGVLSKVAAYGFLRIVLPLFPRRDRRTSRR